MLVRKKSTQWQSKTAAKMFVAINKKVQKGTSKQKTTLKSLAQSNNTRKGRHTLTFNIICTTYYCKEC